MSEGAHLAKLLRDLGGQCKLATRTLAEASEEYPPRLFLDLELALRAARAAADLVAADPAAAEPAREAARAFAGAHEAFLRQSVRAGDHLRALARGWRCGRCGQAAPARAKLRRGEEAVRLECRPCGADTALTPEGEAELARIFGHLRAQPGWDPRANGFAGD